MLIFLLYHTMSDNFGEIGIAVYLVSYLSSRYLCNLRSWVVLSSTIHLHGVLFFTTDLLLSMDIFLYTAYFRFGMHLKIFGDCLYFLIICPLTYLIIYPTFTFNCLRIRLSRYLMHDTIVTSFDRLLLTEIRVVLWDAFNSQYVQNINQPHSIEELIS